MIIPFRFKNAHDISSREAKWGKDFFVHLEDFRQSCESYMVATPRRRTRIAVLDTGINKSHGGIAGALYSHRIMDEWCHSWIGDPKDIHDEDGHGTHCAYLLHKVAPEAEIYVAKVFSHNQVKLYQAENIAKVRSEALFPKRRGFSPQFITATQGWPMQLVA